MGCSSSKDKVCPNCQTGYLPVRRSNSLYSRRNRKTGDYTNHVVSLTSSTLGSLNLETEESLPSSSSSSSEIDEELLCPKSRFEIGLIEAKTWSKMIEEKIPKVITRTPEFTPTGEPEKINAWELMEGLEDDITPLKPQPNHHFRTFSFNLPSYYSNISSPSEEPDSPIFKNDSNPDSNSSEFDPELLAAFRKALDTKKNDKLIVYYTTLRGVRKTYEECSQVLAILHALKIRIDERDVSMHSGFKQELKELLGDQTTSLPRVFIGKNYIGNFEDIRRMNEEGKLRELVRECEIDEDEVGKWCEVCGNIRFIPCQKCSGSCKILYDDDEDDDRGFHRCPDCNENGLLRCPICCN